MTFDHFLYSLILLLLGQIPLLMKLWLDHKERSAPYREHLYQRQTDLSCRLYEALANSYDAVHSCLTWWPPGVPVDTKNNEIQAHTLKEVAKKLRDWQQALKRTELLLPAEIVAAASEYTRCHGRLLNSLVRNRQELTDEKLEKEWEDLTNAYNTLVNMLRLSLGVDSLSGEVHSFVVEKDSKVVVTERGLWWRSDAGRLDV